MHCPYCASDIHNDALVCAVCRRDVQLVKQLAARVEELEQQLKDLAARKGADCGAEDSNEADSEDVPHALGWFGWLLGGLPPLMLLLGAHWVIVIAYDLNTLFLRIVSLLVPLPFGWLLARRARRYRWEFLLLALGLSCLAVLGMSWLTSLVDKTPVLPQGWREWREFAEYAASIGLSLIAGGLMGRLVRQHRQEALSSMRARGVAFKLAELISSGHKGAEKIEATVKTIRDLAGSVSVAGASSASAYMGLKDFLGG